MKKMIWGSILVFVVIAGGGLVYMAAGFYPIGADVPHNALTYKVLEFARERSVAHASKNIRVPDLSQADLLLRGGADYNDMCAGCHLKPGVTESDLSIGLYPKPPNLSMPHDDHVHGDPSEEEQAKRQFWIIKHGIKASGMPAWGPTHSDERIWAMVAFIQRLPELDEDYYQIITARGNADDHH